MEIRYVRKPLLALPVAALVASSAFAADPIEKQVMVTATVPTAAFYVEPVGDWMNDPQDLTWMPVSGSFRPLTKQLQAKSTIGPITAHLLTPPAIVSGIDTIGLAVKVGSTTLDTTPKEVLSATQAAPGTLVGFEVATIEPSGGYKPGTYRGLVNMMFETKAP